MTGAPSRSLVDGADARLRASRWMGAPRAAAVALAVGLVVTALTTWWAGLVAAAVAGGAVWWMTESRALDLAIDRLGGHPLDGDAHPRLANLVDGLAVTAGEPLPEVRVLDDPGANLAVAGPSGEAVMVVTTGLLDCLDRVELEGVLAEGFARIRANDALVGARAASLIAGPLLGCGPTDTPGWRAWGAAWRARRLHAVMGEHRDFLTDLAAVDITRYPPALASALVTMERVGTAVRTATWGSAHLWIAPPIAASDVPLARLFLLHETIGQRVDLLAEL